MPSSYSSWTRSRGVLAVAFMLAALVASVLAATAAAQAPTVPYTPPNGPRERVIVINDLSGDPDGLISTAHALLSPSAEVRAIVGARGGAGAAAAVTKAQTINQLMGKNVPVFLGSNDRLTSRTVPKPTPGSQAIIDEANRTGPGLRPLYVTVGGGLTDVASALLQDPSIAGKFTLVWIGGAEYPAGGSETNQGIDAIATQVVFNDFNVPIWQVPRNAYFKTQVSLFELQHRMAPYGQIGPWLFKELTTWRTPTGESWTLGDNPLVELTALGAWFNATNHAATYTSRPAPIVEANGAYTDNPNGRLIRVYNDPQTNYFMEDFYAKMALNYPIPVPLKDLVVSTPRFSGAPVIGKTISVDVGTYTNGTSFAYQWLADGQAIQGATSSTLALSATLSGKAISVKVVAAKEGYETVTQEAVAPKWQFATSPVTIFVSGKKRVTLLAYTEPWAPGAKYSYQWLRDGDPVRGATAQTYIVKKADVGSRIRVVVTANAPGYDPASVRSSARKVTKANASKAKKATKKKARAGKKGQKATSRVKKTQRAK